MTDLHPCPKCQTPMRTIDRSGIHIEMCPDCRGVFLDRGELDRLLDLEAATLARRASAPSMPVAPVPPAMGPAGSGTDRTYDDRAWQPQPPGWDRRRRDWDDDDDDDDRDDRDDRRGRGRRGGFLGELLEGLGD
jgi:Zn-finger nucleic acid-binding protein